MGTKYRIVKMSKGSWFNKRVFFVVESNDYGTNWNRVEDFKHLHEAVAYVDMLKDQYVPWKREVICEDR